MDYFTGLSDKTCAKSVRELLSALFALTIITLWSVSAASIRSPRAWSIVCNVADCGFY